MQMASVNLHCMNARDKEFSYANNSSHQKTILIKTRPILEDAIKGMLSKIVPVTCIKIADLGCASGPNTFFPTYQFIDIITRFCLHEHLKSHELQVFLNDLPHNDFNTIFRSVPGFVAELVEQKRDLVVPCFIAGVAGSFYQRLFPCKSIHFVHSSYSLQILSKVPEGVENNKRNIHIADSSPSNVSEAYSEQFQKDFSKFLRFRSQEMIGSGRMMLTLIGRSITDPTSKRCRSLWELLTNSLLDLVAEGVVHESDVDSFNLPYYYPCEEEIREIVAKEGSFVVDMMEHFEVNWDSEEDEDCNESLVFEKSKSGEKVANDMRAITESMLASHFGETIMDALFSRYAQHLSDHLPLDKIVNIVVVMTMK